MYSFIKIISCWFVLDFSCWSQIIATLMPFVYECKKKPMVCLISPLVLGMRSIHPIILQLVSHQLWRLPSLCHNSAGFVLPYSWSGLNPVGSPLIYTIQHLCQSDMQNSFFPFDHTKHVKESCHTFAIRYRKIKWQDSMPALKKLWFRPTKLIFTNLWWKCSFLKRFGFVLFRFSQDIRAAGPKIEGWVISLSKQRFIMEILTTVNVSNAARHHSQSTASFKPVGVFLEWAQNKCSNIYTYTHIYIVQKRTGGLPAI